MFRLFPLRYEQSKYISPFMTGSLNIRNKLLSETFYSASVRDVLKKGKNPRNVITMVMITLYYG